jgi:hypothetical protein
MDEQEKAFTIATIKKKIENDEKKEKEIKHNTKGYHGRRRKRR